MEREERPVRLINVGHAVDVAIDRAMSGEITLREAEVVITTVESVPDYYQPLSLQPHREEPLVGLGDGITKADAAARYDRALAVGEQLNNPLRALTPHPVEVHREPEGLLFGPGDESREEFTSANVDDGRGGHGASDDEQPQPQCRTLIPLRAPGLTMTDVRRCASRAYDDIGLEAQISREEIEPSELTVAIDFRAKWKRDAVQLLSMLIEAELKVRKQI